MVVDGVMYISAPMSKVCALDAKSGKVKWSAVSSPATRSTAYIATGTMPTTASCARFKIFVTPAQRDIPFGTS